jgi:protoporphyrin/coproporphyrin ferrochelatase
MWSPVPSTSGRVPAVEMATLWPHMAARQPRPAQSSRRRRPLTCPPQVASTSSGVHEGSDWERQRNASATDSATAGQSRQASGPQLEVPSSAPPAHNTPADQDRIGVLLLNLGGPETLDDVQPFLFNLFADPDIIRLPPQIQFLQPVIAQLVSSLRAPKSREGYEAIGGGSPLRRITEEQAEALAGALRNKGLQAHTYVAMRYWKPFTEDAIEAVKADKITRLVVLPLYPQFSVSTSGSSLRLLERLLKSDPALAAVKHVVIPSWYQRPGYVTAMADLIAAELRNEGAFADPSRAEIFFSAHGVPQTYVDEGDPYKEEMEHCVRLIMDELRQRGVENSHTLAYQSRVGPVEWLRPYTDDSIKYLAQRGVRSLLAVPISFVSEHIETLEEIDMEYRELAESVGVKEWARVPALNTNTTFIYDLADAVTEALPYVGTVAGGMVSGGTDALVPLGGVDALLDTYDKERKVLPPPVFVWRWGWTRSAETWNGRIAMLSIIIILLLEVTTGRGVLSSLLAL